MKAKKKVNRRGSQSKLDPTRQKLVDDVEKAVMFGSTATAGEERRNVFNRRKGQQCILDGAKGKVYGDRAKEYGHPQDNFHNIALLQNAL